MTSRSDRRGSPGAQGESAAANAAGGRSSDESGNSLRAKLGRCREKIRADGWPAACRAYLRRAGIATWPFYYMKETVMADIAPHLTALPEGFEFSVFGLDEMTAISGMEERKACAGREYVFENCARGDTCVGLKRNGEIAAFHWFSVGRTRGKLYPAELKENEAYLYGMYVPRAFRGRNLAPILRYRTYEALRDMGRDTFYSITETSNTASMWFKAKLNAQTLFLAVYFEIFGKKRRGRWVLRRYGQRPPTRCATLR